MNDEVVQVNITGYAVSLALLAFLCVSLFAWCVHLLSSERALEHGRAIQDAAYLECSSHLAKTRGRLEAFEGLLIRTHQTAILAGIRDFEMNIGGGDDEAATVEDFRQWITQNR